MDRNNPDLKPVVFSKSPIINNSGSDSTTDSSIVDDVDGKQVRRSINSDSTRSKHKRSSSHKKTKHHHRSKRSHSRNRHNSRRSRSRNHSDHRYKSSGSHKKRHDSPRSDKKKHSTKGRSRSPRFDRPPKQRSHRDDRRKKYRDSSPRINRQPNNDNNDKNNCKTIDESTNSNCKPIPSYINPSTSAAAAATVTAGNPTKHATVIEQKRKLLWSKKGDDSKKLNIEAWNASSVIASRGDDKKAAKFRKLMGIHDESVTQQNTIDLSKKEHEQAVLFSRLDADYQSARSHTHTSRGVGLGYNQSAFIDPHAYLAGRRDDN